MTCFLNIIDDIDWRTINLQNMFMNLQNFVSLESLFRLAEVAQYSFNFCATVTSHKFIVQYNLKWGIADKDMSYKAEFTSKQQATSDRRYAISYRLYVITFIILQLPFNCQH
jgi:hypothetical protein